MPNNAGWIEEQARNFEAAAQEARLAMRRNGLASFKEAPKALNNITNCAPKMLDIPPDEMTEEEHEAWLDDACECGAALNFECLYYECLETLD